ncbi:MAG TPA: DUF5107 domain-containing protein [Bryobacteraceae bacterium]|nr:DUF5107 domain-containing protein [Bryobacteraceae bacterium]
MTRVLALACALAAIAPLHAEVKAYEQKMTIPTWEIGPPQVHSVFWDAARRGEDRGIYPYTLNEVLTDRKVDKTYNGVVLENEYIKILVLPEIGGRLHGALDKSNGYVWIYWQKTIKPGLISMTGAWISGGIEWNFPHGHRPSGFSKVDHRIVNNPDGSATVWVGETEPIYRMRWLVGMTLFPGRSYVRCEYVFINPTDVRNPFQFWATATTHANEWSQAQYPGDMVTGHGKHEFWNWPIHEGVDLTWWKNVPNASSFFAFNNPSDWFGAYDHKAQGGTVHVADHNVMPGKKLWTWGSGPSGRIWEDILTEGGGPYFEPQAGAWSDNQPDYHWLQPHEVRRTQDYWYPVRDTRGYHNASKDFAVNTDLKDGLAFGGVYSTAPVSGYKVVLKNTKTGAVLSEKTVDISPDKPYTVEVKVPSGATVYDLHLAVLEPGGKLAIEVQQTPPRKVDLPAGQKDPGDPKKMTQDELVAAGEWLDKYTRRGQAITYYEEALRRDPKDARANLDLAYIALEQGRWADALKGLNIALERDPDNARIWFGKGIALSGQRKYAEAYDQFYRATWSNDYFASAHLNLVRLDLRKRDYRAAIEHARKAAAKNEGFADIHALEAAAWRLLGEKPNARVAAETALQNDPMHFMGGYELSLATGKDETWSAVMRGDIQNHIELATAYANAGLLTDAEAILARVEANPMLEYLRGYFKELAGNTAAAAPLFAKARLGSADYVNPHRLEEMEALQAALRHDTKDARAHLYLGNLLYSKRRREEGLKHWRTAASLEPGLVHAWRNVAYAEGNLNNDPKASFEAYRKALALAPGDARVLLEFDQASEQIKVPAATRFAVLEKHLETVNSRDDLVSRLVDLRLQQGDRRNLELAHETLAKRHFRSWEGRYGIHHAWVEANQRLGDVAFAAKDYPTALNYYTRAGEYPKNLEVAPRTPDFRAHVLWPLAKTETAAGNSAKAAEYLKQILAEQYGKPHLGTYYQALAHKALGNDAQYRTLLASVEKRARELTSGAFEHRGPPELVGHYLLALVLDEKGDKTAAAAERRKALEGDPEVARRAVLEAQIDVARAHQ